MVSREKAATLERIRFMADWRISGAATCFGARRSSRENGTARQGIPLGSTSSTVQFHRGRRPATRATCPTCSAICTPRAARRGDFRDADRSLSTTIQTYWTNFAKTGDPNGPGLPVWLKYDGKARKFLEFTATANVAVQENQRGPFADLFRESLNKAGAAR